MRQHDDFGKEVIALDESMREIASLEELYAELVGSNAKSEQEQIVKRDEAAFARERILKLSLHVKNLLENLESHETLK